MFQINVFAFSCIASGFSFRNVADMRRWVLHKQPALNFFSCVFLLSSCFCLSSILHYSACL